MKVVSPVEKRARTKKKESEYYIVAGSGAGTSVDSRYSRERLRILQSGDNIFSSPATAEREQENSVREGQGASHRVLANQPPVMMLKPSSRPSSSPPLKGIDSPWGVASVLVGGVFLIALGARINIPMVPVPMSLQTYAVVLLGGLAGWRLGGVILVFYLSCGALGAPVFADGASGIHHLTGATSGYLLGFLLSAVFVGAMVEKGWASSLLLATLVMAGGHAITLSLGAALLGFMTDWTTAFEGGFRPFLLGGLAKSILAAATFLLVRKAVHNWAPRSPS